MSGAIGPGDWVECVDASPNTLGQPVPLTVGALYCVEDIVVAYGFDGRVSEALVLRDIHVRVAVVDGDIFAEAFAVERFRPIWKPPSTFIASLLQPAPEREHELT